MKYRKYAYLILTVAFALFHVIAFVTPIPGTAAFWIAYAFTVTAFVMQPVIWAVALKGADSARAVFLGIPTLWLGTAYLVLQLVLFAIICAASVAAWLSAILCAVLLALSLMALLAATLGKKVISATDVKVKEKVLFIKTAKTELDLLAEAEEDAETKRALQKLSDDIRYSDPMSDASSEKTEAAILSKIEAMRTAGDRMPLIRETSLLLKERNKKCALMKD